MEDNTTAAPVPAMPMQTATMQYSGFWIRVLAMIIDGIILGIIGYLAFGSDVTQVDAENGFNASVSFTGWKNLVPIIYTIGFWSWISATPGKYIVGIKIVDQNGGKLSIARAVGRYLSYLVNFITIGIGFIWVAFDGKKQGLHDKIAKTYVVKR